jgi:hypothetical protein
MPNSPSNPEFVAVKRRCLISPIEKRRILQAYDRCQLPGERGGCCARSVFTC